MFALLGVLLGIVAITLPELGSNPWPFRPGAVDPQGILAPLVRAADQEWDVGIARTTCFLAALLIAAVGVVGLRRRDWPAWAGVAVTVLVALALMLPSTLLQMGLRQSTEPWFFTNDSTYQIEIGGDKLLDGENPYGADYRFSGMERFYPFDGRALERVRDREVALEHFAYFPGTAIAGAVWRVLPEPFDDYRMLVLLFTLGGLAAALAFRAPLEWRLVIGAVIVANPIAVRSAWFGQNDAPSITLMILAFALATRGRARWAAAALAGAVLLKQFAVVAIPFLAIMLLKQGLARGELKRVAGVFAGVIAAGVLPFFLDRPGGLLRGHRQVRRRHLQGRGLRPVGHPGARRHRGRPRRRLPVRPLRPAAVAAADRLADAWSPTAPASSGSRRWATPSRSWCCCGSAAPSTTTTWCGR